MLNNASQSYQKKNFLVNALNWIEINITEIEKILEPKNYNFYLKAASELLLLCVLYKRKIGTHNRFTSLVVSYISKLLYQMDFLYLVSRNHQLFPSYVITYVSLYECGVDLKLKDVFQKLINRRSPFLLDLKSFQKMDLCYTLDRLDFKHSLPKIESLFKKTILARNPPILELSLDDVYALTHTVFYLSDFGFSGIKTLSDKQISLICWLISSLLGIFTVEKNWDIVGELLICCKCLNYHPFPLYNLAWEKFNPSSTP